ncbi:RNA 2',3'-cyclic phosphodiesterase [Marinimicrobium locisalis]|uniref:RNA 2',3'-cyclic phosphodiesterase n=1 Tax=Marinimicrobium locisalis TaxID=546022 RepID=UPI0032215771
MRVFLGIELPEDVKQSLQSLPKQPSEARWQTNEQLHLTLNFIGEVDNDTLETLRHRLQSPPLEPVSLRLKGVNVFGSPKHPKALWAMVEPAALLQHWHHTLRDRLEAVGLEQDDRDFQPHVTLARFGRKAVSVEEFLKANEEYLSPSFTAEKLCLFASHLSDEGARYEVIERFPVGTL